MKPRNFPEAKRGRQMTALINLLERTRGKTPTESQTKEIAVLKDAVAREVRSIRTKKILKDPLTSEARKFRRKGRLI